MWHIQYVFRKHDWKIIRTETKHCVFIETVENATDIWNIAQVRLRQGIWRKVRLG
jgi:hypothetical protein